MKQELLIKKKELPEGWKFVRLGSILEMNYGKGLANAERKKGEIPVYGSNGVIGFNNDCLIDFNTIIIGRKGSAGELNFVERPCWPIDTTYYVATRYNLKFIYYLLKYVNLKKITQKGAKPGLNREEAYDLITIFTEDETEQQKIVSKLDKQMEQIEMMKKEAEKEKEASEAYYESFTNYLILNLKNGILSKISDVCKEYKKQLPPASEDAKKRIYIGMEDISSNTGIIKINQSNQGEKILSNTFQFDSRHILYGKLRPYLNKVVLPNYSGRCSTELIPLLPKENCKREFLALLLRTKKVIHAAMENKTGSRMPRADMREVMKVEFKLPSLDEQERIIRKFIKFSKDYENLKDYEIKILEAISQLPSSILNEVFGQHKIPEEA